MTPLFISSGDELALLIAAIYSQYLFSKQADLLAQAEATARRYFACSAERVFHALSNSGGIIPGTPEAAMTSAIANNHNAIKGAFHNAN